MSDDRPLADILGELEDQIIAFESILAVDDEVLWRAPSADEWPAAMVLVHMSDAEVHVAARLRYLLTEDGKVFPNWDEEAHGALSGARSPEIALAVIAALRAANIDLVRRLPQEALARTAELPDGEIVDVAGLLDRHTRHTAGHLEQARLAIRNDR
jgi:hypothetical protein